MLAEDLTQRKYIVTGDLTPSLFADDCSFVDPNNAVRGLGRYRKALSFLFEPAASRLGEAHPNPNTYPTSPKPNPNSLPNPNPHPSPSPSRKPHPR